MPSLYIHIPFCEGKCLYCGFYSLLYNRQTAAAYLDALEREASLCAASFKGYAFDTVYIGGGTPTVFPTERLRRIFGILRGTFCIPSSAEITVEANPRTLGMKKLESLLQGGANRLTIGVQSFSDRLLGFLGRRHSARDAEEAVISARSAGFRNIGIDLIYGIPGQSSDDWERDLNRAVLLGPEHISVYCLSLDEGAHFSREAEAGRFSLPRDEAVASQYELASSLLSGAGYRRYEISNFALPGFECQHNMNYWRRGEYLGLGASAWSFVSGVRRSNINDIRLYSEILSAGRRPVSFEERVDGDAAATETLMLGLRTDDGVDLVSFERDYGRDALMRLMSKAVDLEEEGMVSVSDGILRITERGIFIAEGITGRLTASQ